MCANVIQAKTFQLQAPIGSTDTTIAVKNLETIYGDDVVMSGSIQYATLEPESQSNQEIISFTGITFVSANIWNLTGVTRGLDAQPTNGVYGNDPAQGKAHASSVDCILSDSPQVWDDKASKSEDEEVTGVWTFDASPIVPTPDSTFEAANKDYVDNSVAAGASDSDTTTIGISRQSYSPTVTIGTATMTIASPCVVTFTSHGLTLNDSIQFTTTGALPTGILPSTTYYVISAGLTANTFQLATTRGGTAINTTGSQSGTHTLYKTTPISLSNTDPRIAGGGTLGTPGSGNKFITQAGIQAGNELYGTDVGGDDTYVVALTPTLTAYTTGQELKAKMTTANTGACTIDFGPGAKSVKLQDGTDPLDGDVASGKIQTYVYDGTDLILQNPAVTPASKAYVVSAIAAIAPKIFSQPIVLDGTTTGGNVNASTATTGASTTETIFITASGSGGATKILRFEVRTDGTLVQTHSASITNSSATDTAYVAVLGSFVYTVTNNGGAPVRLTRFAKADLSGQTNMTISGTALVNGGLYSDGTNLYNLSSAGNARVYTISGTTATSGSTTAYTSAVVLDPYWCDGTSVYSISGGTCYKWALAGGARTNGTALFTNQYLTAGGTLGFIGGIFKENGNTSYIHTIFTNTNSNIQSGRLIPVTIF